MKNKETSKTMNYKVEIRGEHENMLKAIDEMQDFNSIAPVPKGFQIYKMVPISEDYFYWLLSERGMVSEEQGQKALERFYQETEKMPRELYYCYIYFAKTMVKHLREYGACTSEAWKQKHWGCAEQPDITISDGGIINVECSEYPSDMFANIERRCCVEISRLEK